MIKKASLAEMDNYWTEVKAMRVCVPSNPRGQKDIIARVNMIQLNWYSNVFDCVVKWNVIYCVLRAESHKIPKSTLAPVCLSLSLSHWCPDVGVKHAEAH